MKKTIKYISIIILSSLMTFTTFSTKVFAEETDVMLDELIEEGYEVLEVTEDYIEVGKPIEGMLGSEELENNGIVPFAFLGVTISNLRRVGTTHNPSLPIRTSSLVGGGSNSLSIERSVTTAVSAGFGIGGDDVNIKLGYSKSKSISITDTVSYTCATSYTRCVVSYYDHIGLYNFTINLFGAPVDTGTARALVGFYQTVKLYK